MPGKKGKHPTNLQGQALLDSACLYSVKQNGAMKVVLHDSS
jgi:hypothetical protein